MKRLLLEVSEIREYMKKYTLPLPPTLNHTYQMGKGRYYMVQSAKDWLTEVGWLMKSKTPVKSPVKIEIDMFLKRDRDIDSSLKLTLDALQKFGVIENDKQIVDLRVRKKFDKNNRRLEVRLSEL